jgi:arabinan endo-1,5-alpha-L-arabinosidase
MSVMNRNSNIGINRLIAAAAFLGLITLALQGTLCAVEIEDDETHWVHDPGTIRCGEYFYVYSTGNNSDEPLFMRRSKNLHNWEFLGLVIDEVPQWVQNKISDVDNLWAPEPFYHNGKYYLNYSGSSWGSNDSTIGLLSNVTLDPDHPDYEWVDEGEIVSSTPGSSNYNAIDGSFIRDTSGQVWLVFGSFWSGIKLTPLNSTTLKPTTSPPTLYALASQASTEIEAPHITYRNGYYYLFVNHGLCCRGVDSTYKIMVGRSTNITGPYLDKNGYSMTIGAGTLFNGSGDRWIGPGHAYVFNVDGQDFVSFHAYDALHNGRHCLRVHYLQWDPAGWPVLGEPVTPDAEGVIGCWNFEDGTPSTPMNTTGWPQVGPADFSGNDYHMTVFDDAASPAWSADGQTPSGFGLAADYDGSDDTYTTDAWINNWSPTEWTIEIAVRLDTLSGWQTMVGRDGASYGGDEADFYFQKNDTNDRFRLNFLTVGGQRYILDADFTVVAGQWYYLAGVCDGTTRTMYADKLDTNGSQVVGTLALNAANDNALAAPDEPWSFGRGWFDGPTDQITGSLDAVRFTGRVLTPDEFLNSQCGAWGYLENDLNFSCRVDLPDFAMIAAEWDGTLTLLETLALQWLETTQPFADGAVHGTVAGPGS